MKKIWIIVGIVVVVIVGIIFWRSRVAQAAKADVTTAQVHRGSFAKSVQSSGKTKAKRATELKFQTSGRLAWVNVKEGDSVVAWQALAGLDQREVYKTLQKTLLDYSEQRNTFEDTRKYDFQANVPADAVNDQMKHLLEANQWDLDKSVLDVELKNLSVEFSTLITPIAGIVTHIDSPIAGVNITPATATFEVVDPGSLVFEAAVDETDVGTLSLGQEATITLDAFPEISFSAKLSYISYAAVTSTGGATVFPVEVALETDKPIRVGMNGDVTINTITQDNVLTVPLDAVREDDKGSYVFVKSGDKYIRTSVKLGSQNADTSVIFSGISEGDSVVTKGFATIK